MASIDIHIEMERVRLLYSLAPSLMVGLFVSTTAIASFFWYENPNVSREVIATWILLAMILIFFRTLIILRFKSIDETNFDPSFWMRIFTVGAALSGTLIGIAPVLFLDFSDATAVIFLTLIMFGTLAGALGPLSNCRMAYFIYVILAISPLIVLFFLQGGSMVVIGLLLMVFVAVHLFYANTLYQAITRSITHRFENMELLARLRLESKVAAQANTDKSRLLAATSHDLRQPLHSLSLFLAVLKEGLTTAEQQSLMYKIEQSQQVLNDQLNAIIEVAQIDSGELKVKLQSISSRANVESIVEEFSLLALESGVKIRTRLCEACIDVDPIIFDRIVRNLVSNVIRHCPNSTLLVASRIRQGSSLELMVVDDGPGIAEEEVDNVFSEFYQVNNPERDRNKGMGLGLSIVRRLSRLLNVPVEFKSELGRGTFFKLTFPLSLAGARSVTSGIVARDEMPKHVSGLFIVIVDDEVENLEAIKRLLMYWEAEVLTATSYEELLAEFEEFDYPLPDLMLVDYRLKGGDTGLNLIFKIRNYFNYSVPAAIMTGDVTLSLKEELADSDVAVEYKPVSAARLAGIIGKISDIKD